MALILQSIVIKYINGRVFLTSINKKENKRSSLTDTRAWKDTKVPIKETFICNPSNESIKDLCLKIMKNKIMRNKEGI